MLHHAVPSGRALHIMRWMDRTMKDNLVNGPYLCAPLTIRRRGHTPFVQKGAETSDTGAEPKMFFSRAIQEGLVPMSGMKVRSLVVLPCHSAFHR